MKKLLVLAALALAYTAASASAVWDIQIDALHTPTDDMRLTGTFTTAGDTFSPSQAVTSFSGTFTDALNPGGIAASLVPVSQSMHVSAGSAGVFQFDNLFFFGPTVDSHGATTGNGLEDAFSNGGWLLKAGSSVINLYTDSTVLFSYDYNSATGVTYDPVVGDTGFAGDYIRFDHLTSAVPENAIYILMALGLIPTLLRRRAHRA